jgi:hypothetical protein
MAGTPAARGTPEEASAHEPSIPPLVVERVVTLPLPQPVEVAEREGHAPSPGMAGTSAARGTPEEASARKPSIPPLVVERIVPAAKEAKTEGKAEPPSQPAGAGSRTPLPGVIAQPQVRRVADVVVTSQAQPAVRAEPPPTIQVTIGRIEVRAAPPEPAPAKRAPRPPLMTLDEYLRQRRGGTP